jgi:hypothetical protein
MRQISDIEFSRLLSSGTLATQATVIRQAGHATWVLWEQELGHDVRGIDRGRSDPFLVTEAQVLAASAHGVRSTSWRSLSTT